MEGYFHHHQPVPCRLNRVSQYPVRVQEAEMHGERYARGQTPPEDFGHASGGPVQDF